MRRWIEVRPVEADDCDADPYAPVEPWAVLLAIVGGVVMVAAVAYYVIG